MTVDALKAAAVFQPRGRMFDEFEIGETIHHHWGRTVTEADAVQFSHLTLSYNPLYFNAEYARAHGHPGLVVNPHLVFNIILGLSVEDCSEGIAGPFLGVYDLTYHQPVYIGDTLTAQSVTTEKRVTDGDPNKGVITWHTEGFNQNGDRVIDFRRSNLTNLAAAAKMRKGSL
jgi:acyl dehydratase